MHIVRIDIRNFRGIKSATIFPAHHNVYLGPNNIGKTTVLEALNLLLNPEIGFRADVIDENDFYRREYRVASAVARGEAEKPGAIPASSAADGSSVERASPAAPEIRIEAVIAGLTDDDLPDFANALVPWRAVEREVVEGSNPGEDPFDGAERAIRACFDAWYDAEEDDFAWRNYLRTDAALPRESCPPLTRTHKRAIGFLIYRDFRALQRPITLETNALFARVLQSQEATPKHFEEMLSRLAGAPAPLFQDENFARVVNEFRQELSRYLPLSTDGTGRLSFEVTDRTRQEVKAASQLYVDDVIPVPLQRMGAGTRSLSILAMLLLIARYRKRGILALEEPETFLFPHAQRRIVDEVLQLASQSFITTHSPYVLERMPLESFQRLSRDPAGLMSAEAVMKEVKTAKHLREHFKRQLAEALLGRAAIVVEEESVRLWLLRASALVHGTEVDGERKQALELHGVAVVACKGNGDVPRVARLLSQAGIRTICFIDQFEKDQELVSAWNDSGDVTYVFHSKKGLEDVLVESLPKDAQARILTEPSDHKRQIYEVDVANGWTEAEFKKKARDFLKHHKGAAPFHEEILDQIDAASMPSVFTRVVCLAAAVANGATYGHHSLTP